MTTHTCCVVEVPAVRRRRGSEHGQRARLRVRKLGGEVGERIVAAGRVWIVGGPGYCARATVTQTAIKRMTASTAMISQGIELLRRPNIEVISH
jgi:hypothetical protein